MERYTASLLALGWLLILSYFDRPFAVAATLPNGFQESVVFNGLTEPTAVEFASDGRVFVAEKSGLIKVFDSLTDTTPDIFADLRTNVHNFWDRGLLGLALDPSFPANPDLYVLYTYDAAIGGTAPRWGTPGQTSDPCPNPPGATSDGCVVSGRLSRLQAAGNVMVGTEQVLIEDWCQQYPGHSVGTLAFGPDGALYVSGGDGASWNFVDYGQDGSPLNPCGDPPVGVGGTQTSPTAEGGALRSQSLRRPVGEPRLLHGAILRVDPDSGDALPDNPLFSSADPNARRIVAYGLRNPFRFTLRPGTNEVWVGDVGWTEWEEINRIESTTAGVKNFGWPCYEGVGRQAGYDGANLNLCETLYGTTDGVASLFFTYNHNAKVVPGETCPTGSSSITGLAFYNVGTYPTAYNGALFFADYSRNCIWVMFPGTALVASYSFSEGSGTTVADASGNGYTGTLVNGPTWTSGKVGGGLSFDGVNDSVATAYATDLPAWTISVWVMSPAAPSSAAASGPVHREKNFQINWNHENPTFRGAAALKVGGIWYAASFGPLAANTWYHLAATYDGQTIMAYKDGVLITSNTAPSGAPDPEVQPLTFGKHAAAPLYFQGTVDEIRLYNRALSASEVQADMATLDSTPNQAIRKTFVAGAAGPVDLKIGPGDDLYYVDLNGGTIRRVRFLAANQPPTAVIQATPFSGPPPLTVNFDGTGSSDPDPGDILTYSWDLNGDGAFGDATTAQPAFTYTAQGRYNASLIVSDSQGASATATVVISVGTPPAATIDTPLATFTWKVGDVINFSGHASDLEDGMLPASALSWSLILHHCPSNCHTHSLQSFQGVASGSFSAPDHDYPSYLELTLTATDSTGLTDTKTVQLNPQTVVLSFQSSPSGLQLVVGSSSSATPFSRTVILGSNNSLSAPSPQTFGGTTYTFASWSDGGAQSHNITAAGPVTYIATYAAPTTVTAFPNTTIIQTGSLQSGSAANLNADDNSYYVVNSTTSGTRTTAWYGAFTGVSNNLSNLKVAYKGKNSNTCTQTVAIWRWTNSTWVQLDSRSVSTTEIEIADLVPTGTLNDYVSGTTGDGELRVRVRCTRSSPSFSSSGDLMKIVYDTAPQGPPPSSLVASYAFSEGSGTTVADASGNGYTGTLVNGPTWTSGKVGGGLSFDGVNDSVATAYATDLPAWTISVWVMSPAAPSSAAASGPVHREKNFQINWNHENPTFRGAAALKVGGIWYAASFGPLAANTWYHLAATYDGQTIMAYKDGVLITSNTAPSGAPDPEVQPLTFGKHAAAPLYFQGTVDEIRLYNQTLSAAEIAALANP